MSYLDPEDTTGVESCPRCRSARLKFHWGAWPPYFECLNCGDTFYVPDRIERDECWDEPEMRKEE